MNKQKQKTVIVINGAGGVGKDTMCDIAARHYKVLNLSSIMPIKEIAGICGWAGEKTDKARKFLADLKALTVAYNDFPTAWATARYREFLMSDDELFFMHIREPEEIEKFVGATGAKTLLIRGGKRTGKEHYGNAADDRVEEYSYDYYFDNDGTLEDAEERFPKLLERIINEPK